MSGNVMIHKYRFLIRNLPNYPSKSRFRLLTTTREEFRNNRNETNEKKLDMYILEVDSGIKEIMRYKQLDSNSKNWTINL
ncbi:hypothetical protein RB653_005071 [Dictyostelium firmibasis]|uniref:Complex 1 LYR protein domain-containing protein n=1 Tax=Dictyostelium firmibasis TaxID=79012 RepID=A0AAN7Z3U3_9MYCE